MKIKRRNTVATHPKKSKQHVPNLCETSDANKQPT